MSRFADGPRAQQKTEVSNHVPNPARGLHVYRYGPYRLTSGRVGQRRRECSLTNAAGRAFWPVRAINIQPLTGLGVSGES